MQNQTAKTVFSWDSLVVWRSAQMTISKVTLRRILLELRWVTVLPVYRLGI